MTLRREVRQSIDPRGNQEKSGAMATGQGTARRAGAKVRSGLGVLSVAVFLLGLGFLLAAPMAWAGSAEDAVSAKGAAVQLLAALDGAETLPDSTMARESAGAAGAPEPAGVHLPVSTPKVRLWDDFGSALPAQIGQTNVTVSGGTRP